MFNKLIGYIGGFLSKRISSIQREASLYTQSQIEALRELEDHYYSEDGYDLDLSSFSMSSWASSTSSETERSKDMGIAYFESLENRMKDKGLKDEEFFKEEEFDL
jgi:hypothetical protein